MGGKGAWEKTEERKENEEAEENEDDDEDREAQKEGEANGRIKGAGSRSGRKLSMTSRMRGKEFGVRSRKNTAERGSMRGERNREDRKGGCGRTRNAHQDAFPSNAHWFLPP